MHAQVVENRIQFVDENGDNNLTSIQKCFAPPLVISNVLNAMNNQFGFDFVILNETQLLECVSIRGSTSVGKILGIQKIWGLNLHFFLDECL